MHGAFHWREGCAFTIINNRYLQNIISLYGICDAEKTKRDGFFARVCNSHAALRQAACVRRMRGPSVALTQICRVEGWGVEGILRSALRVVMAPTHSGDRSAGFWQKNQLNQKTTEN
ncbi:hypothetical protein [Massilia sp. S19_KUP03_FR1]|uniref:hypothetical protein n=1 Tax=Massilia sp. S19_KUP03_FR1 TaxID=3025503 RepID=UPI002FCD6C44